jgi:hypothetical protein
VSGSPSGSRDRSRSGPRSGSGTTDSVRRFCRDAASLMRSANGEATGACSRVASAAVFASSSVPYGPLVRARPSSSREAESVTNQRPDPSDSSVNRASDDTYRPASARCQGFGGGGSFFVRGAFGTSQCYGPGTLPTLQSASMTTRRRKEPLGQTIGGVLFGFEQQVLRTAPPAQELVHHARPDRPVPAGDGSLVTISLPLDDEPATDAERAEDPHP